MILSPVINQPSAFAEFPLDLRFDLGEIDSRITQSRASSRTYWGPLATLETASSNVLAIEYNPASLCQSSQSVAVGLGTKTITLSAGSGFAAGTPIRITSHSDTTKWMAGVVLQSISGVLRVSVLRYGGSGSATDWYITECLGLLIEEQRTNLLTYSQMLSVTRRIVITGIVGSYTVGETVTATGGGSGTVVSATTSEVLLSADTGTFSGTLTGATSSATATISSTAVVWSRSDVSVSANTTVAPDGVQSADTITMATQSGFPSQDVTLAASTTYSVSAYFHSSSTAAHMRIRISTAASSVSAFVNIGTKAFGTKNAGFSGGIVEALSGGWYRASVKYLPASGDEGVRGISFSGVTADNGGTADTGKTIVLWQTDCQAGTFITSPISTTSAAATRAADIASMTGANFSSWFNAAEGMFIVSSDTVDLSNNRGILAVGDPSLAFGASESIYVMNAAGPIGRPALSVIDGGALQVNGISSSGDVSANSRMTTSFCYKQDDFAVSHNGASAGIDASGTIPSVTAMSLGSLNSAWSSAGNYLNGHLSRIRYRGNKPPNSLIQKASQL